jgi:protein-S-isoprenylcysteine O-methyltransferase Ste14
MNDKTTDTSVKPDSGRAGWKLLRQMLFAGTLIGALLFLCAGRLDWVQAWVFMTLWFATKLLYVALVAKFDPDLTSERAERHKDTQAYDRVVMTLYLLMGFCTFVVAGLEARLYPQRFTLDSAAPIALMLLGLAVHLALNGLALWAMLTNTFHSAESRLQVERGQRVVSDGPYRYLRHPTYLATMVMWLTTPLILGSWWALLPAALAAGMMLVRTVLEDRMLQRELPGYVEYARRVRFRLLPGVW